MLLILYTLDAFVTAGAVFAAAAVPSVSAAAALAGSAKLVGGPANLRKNVEKHEFTKSYWALN